MPFLSKLEVLVIENSIKLSGSKKKKKMKTYT